jgi:predicted nucleotidyltransferase
VNLQKDLREFIELLLSRGVDFVVIGGHAVAFHGYPRLTDDLDILVRPTPDNAARLMDVLREFGFGDIGISADDFLAPDTVVQLGRAPNRIDLLTEIYGATVDEIWQTRVSASLDGISIMMIGRDALIRNKRATARPQDLVDADKLEGK